MPSLNQPAGTLVDPIQKRMTGTLVMIIFSLAFAFISHADETSPEDTDDETRLLAGKTLITLERNDDDIIDVSGSIYIESTPEQIWAIITDYNNLAETLPKVRKSRLVEDNGDIKIVEQTSKTGVLFIKIKFSSIVEIRESFPDTLSFDLISGDFDVFNGRWLLEQNGNTGTFVNWSAKVKPDFDAPGFIIDAVQKRDLRQLLEVIRDLSETGTTTSAAVMNTEQRE